MTFTPWRDRARTLALFILLVGSPAYGVAQGNAQQTSSPPYLDDRGRGIATSMFGTYIQPGELILYPLFEAYVDSDFEYKPEELGYPGDIDYRGKYRAKEFIMFMAYGFTDRLAAEFEVAAITARLDKSPEDLSSMPPQLKNSGIGDIEGQLRYRWRAEDARRPEIFSYLEAVVPHHGDEPLRGTEGWEVKLGTGFIRGFRWGTLTARAAVEYAAASSSPFDLGEYAVEYLKRLSPSWRVYMGIEGTQDEISMITEGQWHVSRSAFIRLNSGFGLTSKATDWAPEVGIVFTLPTRR